MFYDGKICCFTGHRPQKFLFEWENSPEYDEIRKTVAVLICGFANRGYRYFISGMAVGIDMLCAEMVIKMKSTSRFADVKLECALPNLHITEKWNAEDRAKYDFILSKADIVTVLNRKDPEPDDYKFRNKYMVKNSDLVFAVYTGIAGGTMQTIDYAKIKGRDILIYNPSLGSVEYK